MKSVIVPLLLLMVAGAPIRPSAAFASTSSSEVDASTPRACTAEDDKCNGCAPGALCCPQSGCLEDLDHCSGTPCGEDGTCHTEDLCIVGSFEPEPPPPLCTDEDTECAGRCAPDEFCCKAGGCVKPGTDQCRFTQCYGATGCDGTKMCDKGSAQATPTPVPSGTPSGSATPAPTSSGSTPVPTSSGPTPTPRASPGPDACRKLTFVNDSSEPIWIGGKGGAVVPSCITPDKSCLASVEHVDGSLQHCQCDTSEGTVACPAGSSPARNRAGALICTCNPGGKGCGGEGSQTTCASTPPDGDVCFWTLPDPITHGASANEYQLNQGEKATFCLGKPAEVGGKLSPVWWSGGAFARTGCKPDGTACASAECGASSNGACPAQNGGSKPLTLAEFTLQSFEKDFYDITIIDGVNVSMEMKPIPPTRPDTPGGADADYWCKGAGSKTANGNLDACSWDFEPLIPDPSAPTDQSNAADYTSMLLYNGSLCFYQSDLTEPTGCLMPAGSDPGASGAGTSYCTSDRGGSCLYPCKDDSDCDKWGGSMVCKDVPYSDSESHRFCQCEEHTDCKGAPQGEYCGTQFFPGVKTQFMQVCGEKPRGWWAANDFCADDKTIYGPLDCSASLANPAGGPDTNLAQLFGCTGQNAASCYNKGNDSDNCCGCATSDRSPFHTEWPSAASLDCNRNHNNKTWNEHAQPWLVFLKKACPTAYTYAYDDATSTFTCQDSRDGEINQVGYTITFGDLAGTGLDCEASAETAQGLSTVSSEASGCTAFLSRAVGYAASLGAGERWESPAADVSDWIETATFLLKRPLELIVREHSPDDVAWLSYPLARLGGAPARPRRGIVATDELGTHVLDTSSAERLLVATGTSLAESPPIPQAGLFDAYKCYRVKPSAGQPRPHDVVTSYTDESGTRDVTVRNVPDSLCIEADLGEGRGHEIANVACYAIRSGSGDATRPAVRGSNGAGRVAIRPTAEVDELEVSNRFGSSEVQRGRAREICVPVEIVDRGS